MKPEAREYIRYRMGCAEKTLRDARILFESGSTLGTVNRLYYACFYAVSALLLADGKSSSKHGGTCALFIKYWVNTGRLPKNLGRFYHRLFERRQKNDYEDLSSFDMRDIAVWLQEAEEFVARILEEIRKSDLP